MTPANSPPSPAISHRGFALGMILGLLLGLGCTWALGPLHEFNTEPYQLRPEARHHYMAAIALEFMQSSDLARAISRLTELRPRQDPIQAMALAACELGSSGYLETDSGIAAVRAMTAFYQLQGRSGCADRLLPALEADRIKATPVPRPANAARPPAVPSKTPVPIIRPAAPLVGQVAARPGGRRFEGRLASVFCDPTRRGIIEVTVTDLLGEGLPGERIGVYWEGRESIFASGLKVERGDAYADFEMRADIDYTIAMPGASEPLAESLRAEPCLASGGYESLTSHRVVFRQIS